MWKRKEINQQRTRTSCVTATFVSDVSDQKDSLRHSQRHISRETSLSAVSIARTQRDRINKGVFLKSKNKRKCVMHSVKSHWMEGRLSDSMSLAP